MEGLTQQQRFQLVSELVEEAHDWISEGEGKFRAGATAGILGVALKYIELVE